MLRFKVRILKTTYTKSDRKVAVINNYFFDDKEEANCFVNEFNNNKIIFSNGYVSASSPKAYDSNPSESLELIIKQAFDTIKEELRGLNILKLPLLRVEKPSFGKKKYTSRINNLSHYFKGEDNLCLTTDKQELS